jgi:hypothetical protein
LPTDEIANEWHHYFVKDDDYGFKAKKINFKNISICFHIFIYVFKI